MAELTFVKQGREYQVSNGDAVMGYLLEYGYGWRFRPNCGRDFTDDELLQIFTKLSWINSNEKIGKEK